MIHNNKRPGQFLYGYWDGVGGKIEPGETPKDAVIREVKEESGLNITDPDLKGVMIFRNIQGKDTIVFLFLATKFTGNIIEENDEGSMRWIDDDKILDLNLWPCDKLWLPLLDQDKFFTAEFLHDKDSKLINHKIDMH